MYVEEVPSRQRNKTYKAALIRESYRDKGKVKHRTLANISKLPRFFIEQIKLLISEKAFCFEKAENVKDENNREYGASFTFLQIARSLKLDCLIYSRREPWREDIMAMIVGRIVYQGSKLYLTNMFADTALWELCGHKPFVRPEVEEHCYKPLDKLLKRQKAIQKSLADKHLSDGCMVLYDITNLYAEGEYKYSEIVKFGRSKEKKKGYKQIALGLITNKEGIPIAVEVFRGNVSEQTTVKDQVQKLAKDFKVKEIILAGDRGMLTPRRVDEVIDQDFRTLTALTHPQIQTLIKREVININQFKDDEIGEVYEPDTPEIRYMLCRNPKTAKDETQTRKNLIGKSVIELDKIMNNNKRREARDICASVGKILAKFNVNKYIKWDVKKDKLVYFIKNEQVEKDQSIDGCYIVKTDVDSILLDKDESIKGYRSLMLVEQAFRKLKTVLIEMRPFYHKKDDRLRAHIFLCMLAYYVLWHTQKMLRPLFDSDGQFEDRRWSLDIVIERLKSITKKDIYIGSVGPIKTISTPDAEQENILKLLKIEM